MNVVGKCINLNGLNVAIGAQTLLSLVHSLTENLSEKRLKMLSPWYLTTSTHCKES